jgi:hypothetical protein
VAPTDRVDGGRDGNSDAPDTVVETPEATGSDGGDPGARLARVRRLSRALDSAVTIPRTDIRIGVDPIVGLLPGVGDVVPTAASAYIVAEAAALGVPRATLARMCLNLLVDAVAGSIPLLGDAFDVVWRANDRNVRLLEARLADPGGERRDRRAVAALGAAVFLVVLAVGLAGIAAVWWLLGVAGVV